MTPDTRALRAMKQLKNTELAPLMDYLKATRTEALEQLAIAHDPLVVSRLQGKAQFLQEFFKHVEKSNTLL